MIKDIIISKYRRIHLSSHKLSKINSKLKLLLNKDGTDDKEIIKKIDEIYTDILQIKLLLDMYTTIDVDDIDKFSENLHEEICEILIKQAPTKDFIDFDSGLTNKEKISRI